MAIPIDENVLLVVISVIFIPLFIVMLKMFMHINSLQKDVNTIIKSREGVEVYITRLVEHETELRIIKLRIDNLEKKLNHVNEK